MNVANPIEQAMFERIKARGDGWVFSPVDFVDLGNRNAVDKALSGRTTSRRKPSSGSTADFHRTTGNNC